MAGEDVALVVDAQGGEGHDVAFSILDGDGAEVVRLFAPVSGGAARATWRVELGDRPLPADVTFEARAGTELVASDALTVVPAGAIGLVSLITLDAKAAGPAAGDLGELVAGPPPATAGAVANSGGAYGSDLRAIVVDVAGPRGRTLSGEIELQLTVEREATAGRGDYAVLASHARTVGGELRQVHAVYRFERYPMPGDRAVRVKVRWIRRPGETATPPADQDEHTAGPL